MPLRSALGRSIQRQRSMFVGQELGMIHLKNEKLQTDLVDVGVDVITQHQDSPAAVLVAKENDLWAIGYDSDMTHFAPNHHLTSPIWHWEEIYNQIAKNLHEGIVEK